MKKLLVILLLGIASIGAYADDAAFETPVAPNGSSDLFAGVKSTCAINPSDAATIIGFIGRATVYGIALSSNSATAIAWVELYDSSSTASAGIAASNLKTPRLHPSTSVPTFYALGGGKGVRVTQGASLKTDNLNSPDASVCIEYLEH